MRKKRLIKVSLFIFAVIAILDTVIIRSRSGSMDFGILLPGLGGLTIILGLIFVNSKVYTRKKKFYDKVGKFILITFAVWLVSFIIVSVILVSSAISEKDEKVDCVIVLGAGLNGETITEAEGMKRYLVRHGVPEQLIIKEEKSTSTYENMVFSKRLYFQSFDKVPEKVMIITNDFHMFRSKLLAKRVGLDAYGISSGTPWWIYPNVFLREYLAVFKSLILDR